MIDYLKGRSAATPGGAESRSGVGFAPGRRSVVERVYGHRPGSTQGEIQEQPEPPQEAGDGALATESKEAPAHDMVAIQPVSTSLLGGVAVSANGAVRGTTDIHFGELDWRAKPEGNNWRADVLGMPLFGDIVVNHWPSLPTTMTVPNTPNPVDGGNINNTAGSPNHWQVVIDDMSRYDAAGGGYGWWHSTEATVEHEKAHWEKDALQDALPQGNWPVANQDIDRLTVPLTAHADEAAAKAALRPRVLARRMQFVQTVLDRWRFIRDTLDHAGQGGRGYAAGARVLAGLIAKVRNYATSKGWTGQGGQGGAGGPGKPGGPGGQPRLLDLP